MFISEPPSLSSIRAFRDNQLVTEVNEGETLDVECTVDRVYPVHDLEFQLINGDNMLPGRQTGDITGTNSDGTFTARKVFSVTFSRSYSSTETGLMCKVYHPRGDNQSEELAVIVACESHFVYVTYKKDDIIASMMDFCL